MRDWAFWGFVAGAALASYFSLEGDAHGSFATINVAFITIRFMKKKIHGLTALIWAGTIYAYDLSLMGQLVSFKAVMVAILLAAGIYVIHRYVGNEPRKREGD